jgi:Pseudouridylate synthases, 23S RNA-specific
VPRPPPRDGVVATRAQLQAGDGATLLDALDRRFPGVTRERWRERLSRGDVVDAECRPLAPSQAVDGGLCVYFYREVADEPVIPFAEQILHVDDHLVVVDKPHFLPVMPRGGAVRETLAARVMRRLGNPALVPLHRLDADTAGLVLFSANPATRDAYARLFRERTICKRYAAVVVPPAGALPSLRRSRLAPGTPFFRMTEVAGEANSETRIEVRQRTARSWTLALQPLTGRKHQLRVHLAALGCPILNDPLYPDLRARTPGDYAQPLQLLACALSFDDPLTGQARHFESRRRLVEATPAGGVFDTAPKPASAPT